MDSALAFKPRARRVGNWSSDGLPARIGPYRTVKQLGRGGMGVVYLVEQDEPVRRQLALKLIRVDASSSSGVARFQAERQAMAALNHPYIARIYDAGSTEEGRPYFVMEYVDGTPLNEFCHKNALGIRECIQLFVQICQGIEHAHQKGVIHRDLSPRNILVCKSEQGPLPKIIDFGLAKLFDQLLKNSARVTASGELLGTIAYMSPEQADDEAVNLDTRTDIYSLGVILYELLSGELPFHLNTTRAGQLEYLRQVRESEPERPSSRLSGSTLSDQPPRSHSSVALRRELRGDLDWIIMRTLEKDPQRRYATATEFAQDLQRYLDLEPVRARPPSRAYRARKFVRKHRGLVATVLLVFLLLNTALVIISVLLDRSRQNEQLATTASSRATNAAAEASDQRDRADMEAASAREQRDRADNEAKNAREAAKAYQAAALEAEKQEALAKTNAQLAQRREQDAQESQKEAEKLARQEVQLRRQAQEAQAELLLRVDRQQLAALRVQLVEIFPVGTTGLQIERAKRWRSDSSAIFERKVEHEALAKELLSLLRPWGIDPERQKIPRLVSEAVQRWADNPDVDSRWLDARGQPFPPVELQRLIEARYEVARSAARYLSDLETFREEFEALDRSLAKTQRLEGATLVESAQLWIEARARVAANPLYRGLDLPPQEGLVPLGRNAQGYEEFYHYLSGEEPTFVGDRNAGRWRLTDQTGVVLILLPAAEFRVGAERPNLLNPIGTRHRDLQAMEDEGPIHEVQVEPFFISKYELTQGQWSRLRIENRDPSSISSLDEVRGQTTTLLHPVENISWLEADAFLTSLDLRLPTETEWEFSADSGRGQIWHTGNERGTLEGFANLADQSLRDAVDNPRLESESFDDGYATHSPVGSFAPNRLGLHDIHGNVWELCRDAYQPYSEAINSPPAVEASTVIVVRGGCFTSHAGQARISTRGQTRAGDRRVVNGVRPARSVYR